MTNIDKGLVIRRLAEIKKLTSDIRDIVEQGLQKFLSDPYLLDAAKYRLMVLIEACISVCSHIITRTTRAVPETYADCFVLLSRQGILSEELAERLGEMAKFRNMLAHIYWKVDDEKVYQIMRDDIADIEMFVKKVSDYIG